MHSPQTRSTTGRAYLQRLIALPLLTVLLAAVAFGGTAFASTMLAPFTQAELDTNWEADRQFPSGGVTSVSEFGRSDVARIGITSTATQLATFRRTEGVKTVGAQNLGEAVQVDLYVDPAWEDKAVRAGFWVVGDDGSGARDNWFAIIEFVNLEPSDSGASTQGDHEGWRIWDSTTGWTNLSTAFSYGAWSTLAIVLDPTSQQYTFFISGDLVGTGDGGENFIREAFLNSYNYGLDLFPNLTNGSYAAHWHAGLQSIDKDDCKDGGWQALGFRNQGQCVASVVANQAAGR